MPRKCSPNWVETYLAYTRFQMAPPRYHVWTALSILASTVSRKIKIHRGYYDLFPNLYVAIIGPTGFTKTTATEIGVDILNTLPGLEMIQGKATSWYLYDWFGSMSAAQKDCCCTIYSGEMKDLLGDLNKTEMVTLLTDLYTCPNKKDYHTKGGGKLTLINSCINMLTCSTPEWLTTGTTSSEIHGGFTGRFVYCYADEGERDIAFPEDFITPDIKQHKQNLIDDLQHIAKLSGDFVITDQAKAEYTVWFTDRKKEWKDARLVGYYARKADLVLKISMLLSIARDDSLVIDETTLATAWKILNKVEQQMGTAFSGIVDDPVLKYKDNIIAQIAKAPESKLSRSKILKDNWHKFDGVVLDRIINNCVEAQIIFPTRETIKGKTEIVYKLVKP